MKSLLVISLFVFFTTQICISSAKGQRYSMINLKDVARRPPLADLPDGVVPELYKGLRALFGGVQGALLAVPLMLLYLAVTGTSKLLSLPYIRVISIPLRLPLYFAQQVLRGFATLMYVIRSYKSFTK